MIDSIRKVYAELKRMGVPDSRVVLSSNVELRQDGLPYSNRRRPDDPGVAVYFQFKGDPHSLACDRWVSPEENLWAVAKHIEALRGQDRWGVGSLEQAFAGYKALPAKGETSGESSWWDVLGVAAHESTEAVRKRFASLVARAHPDQGGTTTEFQRVQRAWVAFKEERGL